MDANTYGMRSIIKNNNLYRIIVMLTVAPVLGNSDSEPVVAAAAIHNVKSSDALNDSTKAHDVMAINLAFEAASQRTPNFIGLHAEPKLHNSRKSAKPKKRVMTQRKTTSESAQARANRYWMAHVIYAESGGESYDTQVAVGDVVYHRMHSSTFGDTGSVYDVVFQRTNGVYQFSCVPNRSIYKTPSASAWRAADAVLHEHVDLVPGAYVFDNPSEVSADNWVEKQPYLATFGHLVFAK